MQAHDAGVLSLSLLIVLLPLSITTGALACRIITILHRSAPAAIFLIFNAFFTTALLILALALAVLSVGRKQAHALTIKIISLAILFALWLAACVFAQLTLQQPSTQAEAKLLRATRATAWTSFALVTLALGAALLSTRLTNSTESTRTDVEAKGSLNGSTSTTTTQPTEKETHEETVDSGRNYTPSQSSASVSSSILGIFNPTRRRQQSVHNGAGEGRVEQDAELQEEEGEGEDWEIVDMDDVAVPPASGAESTLQSNGARVVGRRGFKGKLGGRKPSPLPPPGTALPALPPTQQQQELPNSGSASTFVGSAVALTVPKTVGGTSSSSASYSHTELGLDGDSGSPNISIGQQSSSIHTGNGNGNGGGRARGMSILRLPQSLKALAHPHPHQNSESRPSTANESESGVGVGARKIEPNPHLQPQEFGAGSGAPESPNMVAY